MVQVPLRKKKNMKSSPVKTKKKLLQKASDFLVMTRKKLCHFSLIGCS